MLTAALPESSQLDEFISRVAALQGLFHLPVSFPLPTFAVRSLLLFRFSDEKEKLALQHQNELQAQKNETTKLKEELIQAGLRHETALKEAIKTGKAEVEEAKLALIELQKNEV